MSIYKPKMGLSKQIDDIIIERNALESEIAETLLNRDITEDLVNELRLKCKGLQMEVDNLAIENGHFANFLEGLDYSPCEIDNISNGWYTHRTTDLDKDKRIKELLKETQYYKHCGEGLQLQINSRDKRIKELERKLMTIMNVANDANEED